MRVPLSWLREFAPFSLDPAELGRVFDELGMVVEGIEQVGGGLDGVVVAAIRAIEPIPGLDKVRLTRVDPGDGSELEVACGAWNIEPGDVVPLATVGTTLPNGMTIGRRKVRSVASNGMLCSAAELGLGDDAAGILQLDRETPLGIPLTDALGLEPDVVYDLAIEANRPDANSIVGVARDAAARLKLPFSPPEPPAFGGGPAVRELVTVVNECPDLCPRFTASAALQVAIGPSPAWVARRLTLAGMRPINSVVDASNYVMLELGQPTHPYDLDALPGRGLLVRRARPGETVRTLDGVDREVGDGDDCLICDAEGDPVGIGGIMGGASSEIGEATTSVLLEAANFDAMAIARTSKRLNLRTEASARFERGVDVEGIERSVARFFQLVEPGSVATGMVDDRSGVVPRERVTVRLPRVNALLGTSLDAAAVRGYLEPIGFEVAAEAADALGVLPPSFRPDVRIEEDVVEEVARHHGYERIERSLPRSPHVGTLTFHQRARRYVRDILVGAGVDEAQTPSLLAPGDHERAGLSVEEIRAADPMIVEESVLRGSLLPGLLRVLAYNAGRRHPDVDFFEIGKVWDRPAPGRQVGGLDAQLPDEQERLAVALASAGTGAVAAKGLWDTLVAALRLAAAELEPAELDGLHPARTAQARLSGTVVGFVGEVDPDVAAGWGLAGRIGWLDIDLAGLVAAPTLPIEERPVSRFPSTDIDLAFVAPDGVPAGNVERALRASAGDLLVELRLFDVYRGEPIPEGSRSLAYRLRFNALDRTLTDEEVAQVRARCIEAVASVGGELRG